MSAQFVVRFRGNLMWFERGSRVEGRGINARTVCTVADEDHLPTVFVSEAEALLTARDHGLDWQFTKVES